jgi:hypothetical protein
MPPAEPAATEPEEVVDGVPVLAEPAPVPAPRPASEIAVQAATVAGASFVAGAGVVALLRSRRARKTAMRLASGRRRKGRIDVVGTRSFLVDVHFVERR